MTDKKATEMHGGTRTSTESVDGTITKLRNREEVGKAGKAKASKGQEKVGRKAGKGNLGQEKE